MRVWAFFFFVWLVTSRAFAQGGPPLITDDPGTPGTGNWETNLAAQMQTWSNNRNLQAPVMDANYGPNDHLQINIELGYNMDRVTGSSWQSGISVASFALKWRFLDQDQAGFDMSIYPRYYSPMPFSSHNPQLNDPGLRYFFPVEFAKKWGEFSLNPEVGFLKSTQLPDEWDYGIAASLEFEKDREALAEVHRRSVSGLGSETLVQIGTRYAFGEHISFIGAAGPSVETLSNESSFILVYLGVQLRY